LIIIISSKEALFQNALNGCLLGRDDIWSVTDVKLEKPAAMASPQPPADEPPPDHNPEALEDIEQGTFRNVDLEPSGKAPAAASGTTAKATTQNASAPGIQALPMGQVDFKGERSL
jgi:hypothetical protein